jgi:hypothetical protein
MTTWFNYPVHTRRAAQHDFLVLHPSTRASGTHHEDVVTCQFCFHFSHCCMSNNGEENRKKKLVMLRHRLN